MGEEVGSGGIVLVHPTCGPTQADDIPGAVRYKTYEVLKEETKDPRVNWAYLPYSMHMAGSKSSVTGDDFYGDYEAQDIARANAERLGVTPVPSLNLVYPEEEGYVTADVAEEKGLELK